jgi:hypothetical protein
MGEWCTDPSCQFAADAHAHFAPTLEARHAALVEAVLALLKALREFRIEPSNENRDKVLRLEAAASRAALASEEDG